MGFELGNVHLATPEATSKVLEGAENRPRLGCPTRLRLCSSTSLMTGKPGASSKLESRIAAAIAQMAKTYGPQGWWPVASERRSFTNSRGPREQQGYHPDQFDFPLHAPRALEICAGALLTQNTAWTNVRKALAGLRSKRIVTPERLLSTDIQSLRNTIRPGGYFNQKSRYVRALAEWFVQCDRGLLGATRSRELLESTRPKLLQVLGVGPETADSILLYAYALPTFVVDAYTRRVFGRLALLEADSSYETLRSLFERALQRPSVAATVKLWQEAHALIVEHAKRTVLA